MSWDVAVRALIKLDAAGVSRWKRQKLDPAFALPKTLPQAKLEAADVATALARLAKRATYSEIVAKKDAWTLRAILSEDDYLDHARTLFAAFASAAPAGGELLLHGWLTAPEGIAYRLKIGPRPEIKRLDAKAEKALAMTPAAKSFDAWIEEQVAQDGAKRPRKATAFFKEMHAVQPLIERVMNFIQRADDQALVKAVAKTKAYNFPPKKYDTARKMKNACVPGTTAFDLPQMTARDMLRIAETLDFDFAHRIHLKFLDVKDVPDDFREDTARHLHATEHAKRFVETLAFRDDGVFYGVAHGERDMRQWAKWLSASKDVGTELLGKRLRAALGKKNDKGAAQLACYLAAALLLERRAWKYVPEIAKARFEHPELSVQRSFAEMFVWAPVPVAIKAPRLDTLITTDGLRDELWRRLRIDPARALDELRPALEAGNSDALSASVMLFREHLSDAEKRAILKAAPGWARYRRFD